MNRNLTAKLLTTMIEEHRDSAHRIRHFDALADAGILEDFETRLAALEEALQKVEATSS